MGPCFPQRTGLHMPAERSVTAFWPFGWIAGSSWHQLFNRSETTDLNDRSSHALKQHFDENRKKLSRSEALVAEYLLGLRLDVLVFKSAEEIASETGTSDATVIRTAKRLGFSGLPELKRVCGRFLAKASPASERLEQRLRATGNDLTKVAKHMFREAEEALRSTAELSDPVQLSKAVAIVESSDTVWCVGLGTSEVVARHCTIALSRVGIRSRFTGGSGFTLANDLLDVRSGDSIVLFHALRDTADLKLVLSHGDTTQVPVILVSGVQLNAKYANHVAAALKCVGVSSKLASWSLGAIVIIDLLAHAVALNSPDRAFQARERLSGLRRIVGHVD